MNKVDELPHQLVDADLERMVLGTVLTDPAALKRVNPFLAPEDFALRNHQVIWNALVRLSGSGEPIDNVTLYNQLRQDGTADEAGGLTTIVVLGNGLPKILHPESYAKALRTKSLERRIWYAFGEISHQAALGIEKPWELLRQAREVADEIRDLDIGMAPLPYLLGDLERDLSNTPDGLETGYEKLDAFLRIPQGAITVGAGRPGHGKTTMLLNVLVNFLRRYPERRFYPLASQPAAGYLRRQGFRAERPERRNEHRWASRVTARAPQNLPRRTKSPT